MYLFVFTVVFASTFAFIDDEDEFDEDEYALATEDKISLFDILSYLQEETAPIEREMREMMKRKGNKTKKKVGRKYIVYLMKILKK